MMHRETFLREFGPLASGPGGVQKLRELVLQLAVRGKLVPQFANDGQAAEVAACAFAEVPDKIKKQLGNAPQPHIVPANWTWVTLGAISNYGQTEKVEPGGLDDPEFWVLELEDVEKTTSRLLARVPFRERDFRSSKNRFFEGQLLYGKLRPYLDKVIVADRDGCCTTEIVPFSVFGGIDPHFIRWCMKTPDFITYANGSTHGMNLPRMGTKSAIAAPIPLPPVAEQKRIVAKVDELMALCDELEAQQAEETGLKHAAVASALHYLTEAETPVVTADRWSLLAPRFGELFDDLETIKALREELVAVCIQGGISPSAVTWTTSTIGKLCTRMDSGWSPKCEDTPARDNAWGVLKTTSVQKLRFLPEENKALPTSLEPRPEITVQEDDILITRAGPTNRVGIACVVPVSAPKLMLSDKIIRFTVEIDRLDAGFVALALSAGRAAEAIGTAKSGMAASQVNISQSKLRSIEISYPPLAEQKRIVAKVDELMALCDRLEEQVHEGERLNAELMASLVHALTETDPDGGGTAQPDSSSRYTTEVVALDQANLGKPKTPEAKGFFAPLHPESEAQATPDRLPSVDTKFQEAVLVATIVNTFFQVGGEPIGNFRLQKAVYFARRRMGEHVDEMAYLKKAAGPYNPSMKYSGGIAIAKQKNWLREARGRFGFGHIPGPEAGDACEWIDTYGYAAPARWVAEHFRYKKNEEWEALATVDYAIEHLQTHGIEPDAAQILQYIASDSEWRPKIEKLRLTEISVGTAMLEVQALFSAQGKGGAA